MRILIACNSYPTDKNPTRQVFIKNIKEGLTDQGQDVDVLFNPYFKFFRSDQETGNVLTKVLKTGLLIIRYLPFLIFRCRRYDILYSHAPLLPGLLISIASILHNKVHVTYAHGGVLYTQEKGIGHKLSKFVMETSDLVFTNSTFMKEKLFDVFGIQATVITPGYNSLIFHKTNYGQRKTDILFAGNCIQRKGVHLLLAAILENLSFYKQNQFSVKIYCSGVEKPMIVDFVKRHQLDEIITLNEKLSQKELADAFNNAKVVVLPSLVEPLGLVGIEAIACGAFLVGSDTGGIPEYITSGENGILFETGSSTKIHEAIKKVFDDKLWLKSQKTGDELTLEMKKFTLSSGVRETISHFKRVLAEKI